MATATTIEQCDPFQFSQVGRLRDEFTGLVISGRYVEPREIIGVSHQKKRDAGAIIDSIDRTRRIRRERFPR